MPGEVPCFSANQLEAVCRILAETAEGLTGSEIERLLRQIKVADPNPGETKWRRLYNALAARQNRDRSGDRVLSLIHAALDPVRYGGHHHVFERRRMEVNVSLAFLGLEYGQDGRFHKVQQVSSLSEAEARASRLRVALSARGVHPEVLRFCKAELVQGNAFHAVLEATKSVAERLRRLGNATTDGAELVDSVLGGTVPKIRINAFVTESEKSEQRGFATLLKGLFGHFRNPIAHAPRVSWEMKDADALDLFTLCSYVQRRLDSAR